MGFSRLLRKVPVKKTKPGPLWLHPVNEQVKIIPE